MEGNLLDTEYKKLIGKILNEGHDSDDRTGTGIRYLFGESIELNLQDRFPLLSLRKMYFTGIVDELLWMLSGSTNVNDLPERTRHIWDQEEWMENPRTKELGPSYGGQFRKAGDRSITMGHTDQIQYLINNIQESPNSRRHVLSLWQQPDMSRLPLPCCHGTALQFDVRDMKYLDCIQYARSQDVGIGMPWNIAFYALLTHMIAQVTGFHPGKYKHIGGNCHIYHNHFEQVGTLRARSTPRSTLANYHSQLPKLKLNPDIEDIDEFSSEDIELKNYQAHPRVDFPIAV